MLSSDENLLKPVLPGNKKLLLKEFEIVMSLKKLMKHCIHCLPYCYTNDVIEL